MTYSREEVEAARERLRVAAVDYARTEDGMVVDITTLVGSWPIIDAHIEALERKVDLADHIITRISRRPTAMGDYRGYTWAQAEAELSVLIEQYEEGGPR